MGDSGLYMTGLPANADSRSGVNFSRAMLDAFGNSLGSDGAVEQVELLLDANLPEPGA